MLWPTRVGERFVPAESTAAAFCFIHGHAIPLHRSIQSTRLLSLDSSDGASPPIDPSFNRVRQLFIGSCISLFFSPPHALVLERWQASASHPPSGVATRDCGKRKRMAKKSFSIELTSSLCSLELQVILRRLFSTIESRLPTLCCGRVLYVKYYPEGPTWRGGGRRAHVSTLEILRQCLPNANGKKMGRQDLYFH